MGGAQVEHGERGVEAQRREDKVGEVRLLSKVEVHRLGEVCHPILQYVVGMSFVGWTDLSYHIFHCHLLLRDFLRDLGSTLIVFQFLVFFRRTADPFLFLVANSLFQLVQDVTERLASLLQALQLLILWAAVLMHAILTQLALFVSLDQNLKIVFQMVIMDCTLTFLSTGPGGFGAD